MSRSFAGSLKKGKRVSSRLTVSVESMFRVHVGWRDVGWCLDIVFYHGGKVEFSHSGNANVRFGSEDMYARSSVGGWM